MAEGKIDGSEQGWREASDPKSSRYAEKQKDIKKLVNRYTVAHKKVKEDFEQNMEADYFDAALEVANRMQGNFKMGYSHIPQKKWDALWRN
jgi:hypothetical protein